MASMNAYHVVHERNTCMKAPLRLLDVPRPQGHSGGEYERIPLLQLLLTTSPHKPLTRTAYNKDQKRYARTELRRVAASPLAAVGRTGRETSIALPADLLVAVVF